MTSHKKKLFNVQVRFSKRQIRGIDRLKRRKNYSSRSEVVRDAVCDLLVKNKIKIKKRYVIK